MVPSRYAVPSAPGITEGMVKSPTPCVGGIAVVSTGFFPKGCESRPFEFSPTNPDGNVTLFTSSLTPNFMSFVTSVDVLLYPATFFFRMVMSEGISIKPGEMARFKTTFVFFIANLMSEIVLGVMVSFTSLKYILSLQTFCSLSDDGPPALCLSTQHGVDVGLYGELERFFNPRNSTIFASANNCRRLSIIFNFASAMPRQFFAEAHNEIALNSFGIYFGTLRHSRRQL